jgi:hypothetical protein
VAAVAIAAVVEDFELAFKTGSADFVFVAWERGTGRLAMPLVGWGSLSAEKNAC